MTDPAAVLVVALRLDRWRPEEVANRVGAGLDAGVGGFVLFGGTLERAARTCALARRGGDAIWLGSDLERGPGQQFAGGQTLPPPRALAEHAEAVEVCRRAGALTGRQARDLGLNWVLAPVLDLDVEARNPIVGTRSFGASGERVGELAAAWIEGCQSTGVAACAKHFPGHGRTATDSHLELPSVDAPADVLSEDLAPFRRVSPFVTSIMTAHVAYPRLGDSRPATLSHGIVSGLLREALGFEGVIATDAMIMAGAGDGSAPEVEAIRAGCDLIVYPADPEGARTALSAEAERDPRFADRVRRAVARSRRVLARQGEAFGRGADAAGGASEEPRAVPPDAASGTDEIWIRTAVETLRPRDVDLTGWNRSAPTDVHLVWDDPTGIPEIVDAGDESVPPREFGTALVRRLEGQGWAVGDVREIFPAAADPAPGSVQRIVAVASTPRGFKGHASLSPGALRAVDASLGTATRGLLIVFGHPRLVSSARRGLCAWGIEPVMQEAAADWLSRHVGAGSGAAA